ncbi:ABC transporter ATP-binding protein [Micromonospora sp. NPDC048830]|uniref:ABC transporter ATP-binding protein n=1 Tax=Micromonospora sp. NPDC048830 TaxID=3364257 RepID=UPI003717AB46
MTDARASTVGPLVDIRALRICYRSPAGAVPIVRGVDLDLHPGETVGLVGESGSGKSVTGRAILGLLEPRQMAVAADRFLVDGVDMSAPGRGAGRLDRDSARRRPRAAMIFQNPFTSLNPSYTIGNLLREVIRRHHGLRGRALRERAVELLDAVKLPDPAAKANCYPHQLSGGQQQRVVIAVALAMRPRVLIADEPTTALDVTVQAEIVGLLRELQADNGMGILFVSHDLALISDVASRVFVMRDGEIVERGDRTLMTGAAQHPYTKALLAAAPSVRVRKPRLPSAGTAADPEGSLTR